jgi:hypothetical protein
MTNPLDSKLTHYPDELGRRERTPERYIKNVIGVFRLRLRAGRARPESRSR